MAIQPQPIKSGDTVGIVAASRMITADQIATAIDILKSWGLKVVQGQALLNKHGYFAGTDEERLNDLQNFINREDIQAVFLARGGYGMTRIIDRLDLTQFIKHPKWVIGFSDVTALHLKISQQGIESIHGLMPAQFGYPGVEQSISSLKNILFEQGGEIEALASPHNRLGSVQAPLIGGNLSLLADSLGTPTELETAGKILFIEEVDEYLYKIDRMLVQLKRGGKFNQLAGMIIGDFSDMKDTQIPFGKTIEELIVSQVEAYDFPVAFNFPIGHENHNLAVPVSRLCSLTVGEKGSSLTF